MKSKWVRDEHEYLTTVTTVMQDNFRENLSSHFIQTSVEDEYNNLHLRLQF